MTTSKGASQYNKLNWEESDFPIVCETCFGENPYMRMTKDRYGKECGVCLRPFTVFRWQNDREGKFRSTEICQVCTRTKNVCQSCIMDLEYGLPVQVRDKFLNIEQNLSTAPVNLEYNQQLIERQIELSGDISMPYKDFAAPGKAVSSTIRKLAMLAQTEPYSKNRPNICTFYVKGECKRGEECPYRHEKPSEPYDPINDQHIKDRYYGVDDNIAQRIIEKYETLPKLSHPEDKSITTIDVYGLPEYFEDKDVIGYFYQFGEVRKCHKSEGNRWSVQFANRESSEKAAQFIYDWNQLGYGVKVDWSQFSYINPDSSNLNVLPPNQPTTIKSKLLPPLPQPKKPQSSSSSQINVSATHVSKYPSQDPERLGNKSH